MIIPISDQKRIHEIQEDFAKKFPYLKIEFISKSMVQFKENSIRSILLATKTLGECRSVHTSFHVVIIPEMTVGELVNQFLEYYGLKIQVFRKSGGSWLLANATSEWTLEKQNIEGEAL